ncbi:hypothetical protein E2320_020127, partial [Naja naja]
RIGGSWTGTLLPVLYGKEEGNRPWQEKKEGEKLRHIQGVRGGDGEDSGNLLALARKEGGRQRNDRSGGAGKQEGRGGEPEPAWKKRQVPMGGGAFQGAKGTCHCSSRVQRRSGRVPGCLRVAATSLLPRARAEREATTYRRSSSARGGRKPGANSGASLPHSNSPPLVPALPPIPPPPARKQARQGKKEPAHWTAARP